MDNQGNSYQPNNPAYAPFPAQSPNPDPVLNNPTQATPNAWAEASTPSTPAEPLPSLNNQLPQPPAAPVNPQPGYFAPPTPVNQPVFTPDSLTNAAAPTPPPQEITTSPLDLYPSPLHTNDWTPPVQNPTPQTPNWPSTFQPDVNPPTPASALLSSTPAANQQTAPTTIQPSWNPAPIPSDTLPSNPPPVPEAAPTDLSHLISNNSSLQSNQAMAENMVAPVSAPIAEMPTVAAVNHKGVPHWLVGLALGLLVLVAGASAYFILGVGQPVPTTSVPATIESPKPAAQIKQTAPVATPAALPKTSQPAATGSADFGQLQGNTNPAATSAAEIIRQRQQGI